MIECKVCGAQNSDLALTCTQCKSFLQAKVDTLDLFATAWAVIESPARAFKRVVLAKRKNYVFFLSVILGMGAALTAASFHNLGPALGGLPGVVGAVILGGIVMGMVGVPLVASILVAMARLLGGAGGIRPVMAVIAYASVPVLAILIVVVPIKLAIFGQYLFDHNPSPMVLAPGLYLVLTGLEGLGALWSLALMAVGLSVATGLRGIRPVALALLTGALAGGLMWALGFVRTTWA